jgi:hypothetical protein
VIMMLVSVSDSYVCPYLPWCNLSKISSNEHTSAPSQANQAVKLGPCSLAFPMGIVRILFALYTVWSRQEPNLCRRPWCYHAPLMSMLC